MKLVESPFALKIPRLVSYYQLNSVLFKWIWADDQLYRYILSTPFVVVCNWNTRTQFNVAPCLALVIRTEKYSFPAETILGERPIRSQVATFHSQSQKNENHFVWSMWKMITLVAFIGREISSTHNENAKWCLVCVATYCWCRQYWISQAVRQCKEGNAHRTPKKNEKKETKIYSAAQRK